MLTRAIEQAQTTVESRNFQSRKSVLEYDDVMNKQREIIYDQRKQVLEGMDVKGIIMNMMSTAIGHQVSSAFGGESHMDEAGMRELLRQVEGLYFPKYAVRFEPERIPPADGCRRSSTPLPPPLPTSTKRRSRSSPPPSCVRWSVWCCCGW